MPEKNKKFFHLALVVLILLAAFSVRFYNLGNLPSGVYPDETVNGVDALQANETGNYKFFYPNNNGREGFFINLQALSLRAFGNSIAALRLWSAIFGTLTVLGVFLLTTELFRNIRAGFIGAFLTAFSYWAINFSRIGFRAIMVPFILSFAFYFLFRGLRTKKILDFLISGAIYGLGLHTYIAFRVSPLVLIVLLAGMILVHKRFLAEYWKHIAAFAVAMFIVSAPMLLDFFYFHPEHYASRTTEISVLNPNVNQGHLLKTVAKTFALSLAKYNFWGDQNWRQNYPPYPILNPLTGLAFLVGLIYIIVKFFHLLWLRIKKGVRDEKLYIYLFLLAWFFTLLIPEFLANEGNPHALRSIGTLPAVMIIAVIPFIWIFGKLQSARHAIKTVSVSLLICVLIFIAVFDLTKYFVFFANNPQQHGAFDESFKNMAVYLNSLPDSVHKYVLANAGGVTLENGLLVSSAPIQFLTYRKAKNLEFLSPDTKLKTPMELVMMNYDQNIVDRMKMFYPASQVEKIDLDPGYGSDFSVITVKN
jgi:4-amino-4-deoxy-L-arabinose transferase-like glycosyltransferase